MNILYGIVGDGLGHSIRSSVIIRRLIEDGHDVHIVVSGDGLEYMKSRFPNVSQIWGLQVTTKDNRIDPMLTAYGLFRGAISGVPRNILQFFEVARQFEADLVITDFDSWSNVFAKLHDIPVIALDNCHLLTHVEHPEEIVGVDDYFDKYKMAQIIAENRVPGAAHYMVSSFACPRVTRERTTLVPPVLRPAILETEPNDDGDHLLVYQTSYSTFETKRLLEELDVSIKAYGLEPGLTEDRVEGNITYRPFSEQGFIDDLASCRALFASSGFTLMTEAMHLGKPYFALPVEGQIEQMVNARYLRTLGYGDYSLTPTAEDLHSFLERLPEYRANLQGYERADNSKTFDLLYKLMEELVPNRPTRPKLLTTNDETMPTLPPTELSASPAASMNAASLELENEPTDPKSFAILDATHHADAVRPNTVVAGLEMVRRQVRLAHVSDCEKAIVVTTAAHEEAVRDVLAKVWFDIEMEVRIAASPALSDVFAAVATDAAAHLGDDEVALYYKTTTAYYRHLPKQLRDRVVDTGGTWFYTDPNGAEPGDLIAIDRAGFGRILTLAVEPLANVAELYERMESVEPQNVHRYFGDDRSWTRHLATQKDADLATEQIWQDCRKSVDGPVSRYFNRYISLFISRRVAGWGIKANHVTAVTALLGVVGGLLGMIGGYWGFLAAGLAYKTNSIVDGVDGEMARGKYEFSEWGAWLDNFSDDSKDVFFYIGVSLGAYWTAYPFVGDFGPEVWLWLLGITLFGKALSLSGYYSFLIQNNIGDLVNFQFWFEEEDESPRQGLASKIMAKLKILTKNDVMVLGALLFAVAGVLPWFIFIAAIGQVAAGINIIAARIWQARRQDNPLPAE
jgi:uncharacterized protein (TIGR00661 family)